MKIPFSYSFRNLWTRRLTTILTLSGVALVVFVFVASLMLSEGLRQTLVATGVEDNAIVIRRASQAEVQSAVSREQANIIKTQPEVALDESGKPLSASDVVVLISLAKRSNGEPTNVVVRGTSPEGLALRAQQVKLIRGRMFEPGLRELIVGKSLQQRFQSCELGGTLRMGGTDWQVVGVFDGGRTGFDSEIWGDVEVIMAAWRRSMFSSVTVRLRDPQQFEALRQRLESDPRMVVEVKREKQYYDEQSKFMAVFINVLGTVVTFIFSFGAMIGAMITMYAAVSNRTQEIGTLRALGFRRRSVLAAFLIESVLLAVLGGLVGVLLSSLLQFVSISTTNWNTFSELAFRFKLSPGIVLQALIFAVIMGLAGGFLPAVRASRLKIVEALRTE
ncbi:MAG: ABC transporter permease [candidate division KSB1 bacterium]|nr:ABC transporter permease [candidate division KSB1 bacterium]MDZ7272797.1 ABC transporter permease [candidate division KSB1 bacterium]MDZ7284179.1 ABC transporter permease [candidate division KSB1 bacterium]MDZ7297423.1 ABC transporter permease [candidate division KSB1 bacterium]MDZ7348290.1 ABC transporter permease [candidate division KSB1 bacterium]